MTKPNVLVVDDSSDVRMVVKSYLELWPVNVDEAANGIEAINLYKKNTYIMTVVDLVMPVMDGASLIHNIRRLEEQNKLEPTYIVVVSGSMEQSEWQKAVEAGMDSKLEKPLSLPRLCEIMSKMGFASAKDLQL